MLNFSSINQIAVAIIIVVVSIWLIGLTYLLLKTRDHYAKLIKNQKEGNLEQILEKLLSNIKNNDESVQGLKKELENVKKDLPSFIQRVGLVRFNPYKEVGGDQSFSLAILDEAGNGVVISALHSRDATRMYAKPVRDNKQSKYPFSEEESDAVKTAERINNG